MICFIILHYMVEKETEKCVDSILKLDGDKKIVVVDNCSPNNSFALLKEYYQNENNVDVIQNSENAGFARGNNFGYQYALEKYKSIDFMVTMNNDMEITQKDFITKIYEIYEKEKFYVLAPDVFSTQKKIHQNPEIRTVRTIEKIDKELERLNKISKPKLYVKGFLKQIPYLEKLIVKLKNKNRNADNQYKEKCYNKTLHGSCLIFSKLFIDKREEAFFNKTKFYCEAQILDYECEHNNWMRLYDPSIQVLHHEDVATNATYQSYVKKSLFQIECEKNSLNEFKKLIAENERKKE